MHFHHLTAVRQLRNAPQRAALLLDIDGTLAPFADHPDHASVPADVRREIARLAGRYALVACVTGRSSGQAARILGMPDIPVVGNHGLDLDPEATAWRGTIRDVLADIGWPYLAEDKGVTATLHFRDAPDDDRVVDAWIERAARHAHAAGLRVQPGRKILELFPPVAANKGLAVRRLLAQHNLDRALYAGDDATDIDGFAGLDGLALGVRVAVDSTEAPAALRSLADVVVDGTAGIYQLLRAL